MSSFNPERPRLCYPGGFHGICLLWSAGGDIAGGDIPLWSVVDAQLWSH